MGFLKQFFSPNPWKPYDADWSFRNRVTEILGTWDFSKLETLMQSGNMFDHDFFTSGRFNQSPDEDKLDLFAQFIESWASFLTTNGLTEDADFISKMASKLRSRIPKTEVDSLPKWFSMLPHHLQPPISKVPTLEKLRRNLQLLPDEVFMMGIAVSPWAVIRAQQATLDKLHRQLPDYSERDLWRAVIFSRFEVKLKVPSPWDPPTDEILKKMQSMDQIMKQIDSWEDALEYILDMDKEQLSFDPSGIQGEINQILSA